MIADLIGAGGLDVDGLAARGGWRGGAAVANLAAAVDSRRSLVT